MLGRSMQKAMRASPDPGHAVVLAAQVGTIVELCEKQGKKLTRLLTELLDLTRIRLGRLELNAQPADLSQIARETIERKPIELRVRRDAERGLGVLPVRDHGMGIAPELQRKIFERFERAVEGQKISGLGLGLDIARQLVEAHGGHIGLESTVGEGSAFRVELPLALHRFDEHPSADALH